jgi:hypothetical protein
LNTSTVALRGVEGDEDGSLESEEVNMITSHTGLGPENDCADEAQHQLQTINPSFRHRERESRTSINPHLFGGNKNLVVSPEWLLYSNMTG